MHQEQGSRPRGAHSRHRGFTWYRPRHLPRRSGAGLSGTGLCAQTSLRMRSGTRITRPCREMRWIRAMWHALWPVCDAVVQTLGVTADPATLLNPVTLFSQATQVLLTQIRALADDGTPPHPPDRDHGLWDRRVHAGPCPLPERVLFEAVMGRVAADKERQESLIPLQRHCLDHPAPGLPHPCGFMPAGAPAGRSARVAQRLSSAGTRSRIRSLSLLRTGEQSRKAVVLT